MDDAPDAAGRIGAALLFLRWEPGADRPAGHLETEYLAFGRTPDEALAPLLALSLADVKARLDVCVEQRMGTRDGGRA